MTILVYIPLSPFSTSSFNLAINSNVTSAFENANTELGVSSLTSETIPQDNSWYEIIITHMHDERFWLEIMEIIQNKWIKGHRYGALICPRSERASVTLGPLVHLTSETTEPWLRNHFEPILNKMEEDYDEEFSLDTKIKLVDISQDQTSNISTSKKIISKNKDTEAILQAMQTQQNAMIQTMQSQTNAILQANAQILQAMQTQQAQPIVNWTPLIQAVATAVPAMVGVPVAPVNQQPTQTTAAPAKSKLYPYFFILLKLKQFI